MSKLHEQERKTVIPCPCCEGGGLVARVAFFKTQVEGKSTTVPDVEMERCDQCGEEFLTPAGTRQVDDYLDSVTATISAEELQRFLDQYQLTQKQAAEILQIGGKNFSRWLNGRQRVSASMSSYIRTLIAVPEAFHVLKSKQWSRGIAFPAEEHQPVKEEKAVL